jgi:hypothetical protein
MLVPLPAPPYGPNRPCLSREMSDRFGPDSPPSCAFPPIGQPVLYCVTYYPKTADRDAAKHVLVDGISGEAGKAQESVRRAFGLKEYFIMPHPVAFGTPGKRLCSQLELFA